MARLPLALRSCKPRPESPGMNQLSHYIYAHVLFLLPALVSGFGTVCLHLAPHPTLAANVVYRSFGPKEFFLMFL